ncbi:translation initiation factor IF-2-like [Trachypithecus francoisi]|uniref:translation initiation factor IF-2-like n=1 Tax=Trachypithecus francoisi TaxID=54180 RepID=UPI00141BECA2|nr:translation initiation factor IF-2-like [Trachypithecus francoisi]
MDAHTRNPRGGHQRRALCAQEIYSVKCRKAPTPPERVLPPRRWPSRPSPPEALGTRLTRGSRSSKSEPWALSPRHSARGARPPPSRSPPAVRSRLCCLAAAARAALLVEPARRGRRTLRRGARRARAADPRSAPETPSPAPAPCSGAPAPRLGSRFLSARGGGEQATRAGEAGAQQRGRPSRPPWFRSIVGRLTQTAAIWPRLAPSPPGAPWPGGARPRWGSCGGASWSPERQGHYPPSWDGDAQDLVLAPPGQWVCLVSLCHPGWSVVAQSRLIGPPPLRPSCPPTSAFQAAGITEAHHQPSCCIWPLKRQVKGKRRLRGRAVCELDAKITSLNQNYFLNH